MTTQEQTQHVGYVLTDNGQVLLQVPDDNQWGFALQDDDQTWPGGFGAANSWKPLKDTDRRITKVDRERLGWILKEARASLAKANA